MTNQQLIKKIKEIIKDDNIMRYYVFTKEDNIIISRFNLQDPINTYKEEEVLCKISDMSEELELRPFMRKFQVTETDTQEVHYHFSMIERLDKTLGYKFKHKEVEIK